MVPENITEVRTTDTLPVAVMSGCRRIAFSIRTREWSSSCNFFSSPSESVYPNECPVCGQKIVCEYAGILNFGLAIMMSFSHSILLGKHITAWAQFHPQTFPILVV